MITLLEFAESRCSDRDEKIQLRKMQQLVERGAKWAWQPVVGWQQGRPLGPQDAEIEFRAEEGHLQAVTGGRIAMRLRDAMDQPFEAEASEVIGHLRGGVGPAEERLDLGPEFAIAESAGQMGEASKRLKERHDARVAEAQGGCPLVGFEGRALEPIERLLRQDALMTDAFDFQKLAIDLVAEVAQV